MSLPARIGLCVLLIAGVARGQEELDEVFEGFDDEAETSSAQLASDADSLWDLSGSASLGASINYAQDGPVSGRANYRGLSRLRAQLSLQLDADLPGSWKARVSGRGFRDFAYALKGRSDFTHEVRKLYESELELQETYLQGSLLPNLDLKLGRQIVVWGRSESLRVLDVLNPLDNIEPGLVDLEDLRLPVAMTRLDYYLGTWSLTGIAIHESRFDRNPVFGSDFSPLQARPPGERRPASGGSDTEYAVALAGIFPGWDLSLHWARYFEDAPHTEVTGFPPALQLAHSQLTLWGASAQVVSGNWLLKSELARIRGFEFAALPRHRLARTDLLLGFEYAGLPEGTLAAELAVRHLHGFAERIEGPPDFGQHVGVQSALRYTGSFLNDTLRVIGLVLIFGERGDDGSALRVSAEYDLRDAVTLGAGILLFENGDLPPFGVIDHADRLFLSAKYSF